MTNENGDDLISKNGNAFIQRSVEHVRKAYLSERIIDSEWAYGTASVQFSQLIIEGIIKRGSNILDIGCGYGQNAIMLAANGMNVTGLDIVPKVLERARSMSDLYGTNVRFVMGDVLKMPFENEEYDWIVDSFVYHNIAVDNRFQYAKELSRVLKPCGKLAILGFSDRMSQGSGPIRLTSDDIIGTFIPEFRCIHMEYVRSFPTKKRPNQIHWFCLWEKR